MKDTFKKLKRQASKWKTIFAGSICSKVLSLKICKKLLKFNNQQTDFKILFI